MAHIAHFAVCLLALSTTVAAFRKHTRHSHSLNQNCSPVWGQCGGKTWTGPTCCQAGSECISGGEWYSSCKPSANPTPLPHSPTPSPPHSTTNTPPSSTSAGPAPKPKPTTTLPASGDQIIDGALKALQNAKGDGVFQYMTPSGSWLPSDIYTWPDMVKAVSLMATKGVGKAKLWLGDTASTYGLVNVAAFLAQSMQESIRYNACDENNWSDKDTVAEAGGSLYTSTGACGQLHQSYQDYKCTAEEDETAGGSMACPVDPEMEMRAFTQAEWYGAPPKLFCAPKSKVPKAPRWDISGPWCPPEDGWGHEAPFPDRLNSTEYYDYINSGGSCKDYQGIKTGGWKFTGEGCINGACPNSKAPLFGKPEGRTDLEGCCWWGRGVIQTTGTCNFGKLNYFLGKRAQNEGRDALFPQIDFCKNPNAICDPTSPPEVKWVAGFFYWLNSVQPYESVVAGSSYNYINELKQWVDNGMSLSDNSFIDGASGIVNRGCHNPPHCGTGDLHAAEERRANFKAVLQAMGLV